MAGFCFSSVGWISTFAALGSRARTTIPEPSPKGCIPKSWCGARCLAWTKLCSSSCERSIHAELNRLEEKGNAKFTPYSGDDSFQLRLMNIHFALGPDHMIGEGHLLFDWPL